MVFIPASDRNVLFASRRRSVLGGMFHMALPAAKVVEDLVDKKRFAILTDRTGFPSPRSVSFGQAEDIPSVVASLGLPFIAKARIRGDLCSAGIPKTLIVQDDAGCELLAERLRAEPGGMWLAQTYIAGDDECHVSVAVCMEDSGQAIATFTARKRRQTHGGAGVGTCVVSAHDEEATALAVEFLRTVGYVGVAEVELKRDVRTGLPYLVEVNARLWSQAMLAAACGYNFALMQYDLALGRTPRPNARSYGEVMWQDVWDDFYWSFCREGYREQGRVSVLAWLSDTLRARAHPYASWRDPGPFARRVWGLVGEVLSRRRSGAGPGRRP
jgi:predicted ATP-grasp superfamily ATP-dependent carboligase